MSVKMTNELATAIITLMEQQHEAYSAIIDALPQGWARQAAARWLSSGVFEEIARIADPNYDEADTTEGCVALGKRLFDEAKLFLEPRDGDYGLG